VDVLSEIVTKEFLVLMEVSDRQPSLPMNLPANADAERRLLPERRRMLRINPSKTFWLNSPSCVQRSFVALRAANHKVRNGMRKHDYVADVCVTRFNEQIDEIERWRSS